VGGRPHRYSDAVDPAGLPEYGEYREEPPTWRIVADVLDGSVTVVTREFGEQVLPDGKTTLYSGEELRMTARDADPARALMENEVVYRLRDQEGAIDVEIEASGSLSSTETDFALSVRLGVRLAGH